MAKLIKAYGSERDIEPKNGLTFELEELQAMIGGHIEIVVPAGGINDRLVVNEDGRALGLRPNFAATCLAGFPIVGDIVLCAAKEIG